MKVKKELYFESPFPGVAVYAHHQCYTASSGNDIIEAVRYEARNEKRESHGGAAYYGREMYRRISYDNGKNWEVPGYICYEDPLDKIEEHPFMYQHFRDHRNNMLVSIHETKKYDSTADKGHERFSDEGITTKRRLYYQISADKGRTWSKPERIIAKGAGFDDIHWGPGLYYGKNGGGGDLATTTALPGGTFCFGGTFNLEDGKKYQAALLHGRWLEGLSGIEWEFSDYITTRADQSSQGCLEPVQCLFDDGSIFVSLRCCGDRENKTFPSMKYWVISKDGGKTFSQPEQLKYEDGSIVWSPSSYAGIIRSSVDGKFYWIGNILDRPTYGAYPRYPLCIAELDQERKCLIKDSVTLIDTKPENFKEERRRYTNFGFYEDRETKEIIVTLPEQPRVSKEDFTSDCYRYKISIN